jgi:predicted transcriptional regulator
MLIQILMVMVKFEEEDNDEKVFAIIVHKVDNDIKCKNLNFNGAYNLCTSFRFTQQQK